MTIIKCIECNKEYSDTLNACPHCGFVRQQNTEVGEKPDFERIVLDDGSKSELASRKDRISAQKAAYAAEEDRVKKLLDQFRYKLETARDYKLEQWKEEFEASCSELNSMIAQKQNELSSLGVFALGQKKQLKNETMELQQELLNTQEKLSNLEDVKKRMDSRISKECRDSVSHNTYGSALKQYLAVFKEDLERDNSEMNQKRVEVKDRIDELLAESDRPVEMRKLIVQLCQKYPEYQDVMQGYFKTACVEMGDTQEGRIRFLARTGFDAMLMSKRRFHNLPTEPDVEEVLNPISELEKVTIAKNVQAEKGEAYNDYMNDLAVKYGWKEVREERIKSMNRAIQQEALTSMQLVMSAKSAADNSKKGSPAIAGGVVNALAGPVAGVMAAYHTAKENELKDIKRRKAELERDAYFVKHSSAASLAEMGVNELYLLDYELLRMDENNNCD